MAEVPELPYDVWRIIFGKLTYNDQIRIMGVCRHWRDCGYEATSHSLIWQLSYEYLSDSTDRFLLHDADKDEQGDRRAQQPADISLQSRIAFISRRQSSLKLISIGNIPADQDTVMGILLAIGHCDGLLALDLQVTYTGRPLSSPGMPVLLPSHISYLRTNLTEGFISAGACRDRVRYADMDVDIFDDIQGPVFSMLTALTLHRVWPSDVTDVRWRLLPAIRMLDLHYAPPERRWEVEVIQELVEDVLPQLDGLEELRLYLPHLNWAILRPLEEANLKSVSLSCQTCKMDIQGLLYWPQLNKLHIARLDGNDLVIGCGPRWQKMSVKQLVIDHFDGFVMLDPEILVGRYASLQHLELGCEAIDIYSEVEDPQALVPLEGQSCNLIIRTKFELVSELEDSLLDLGYTSIPSNNTSASYPHILFMQFGCPELASLPQSILPKVCDPFPHDLRTSFAINSEEYALLLSKEYQEFWRACPWSVFYMKDDVANDAYFIYE